MSRGTYNGRELGFDFSITSIVQVSNSFLESKRRDGLTTLSKNEADLRLYIGAIHLKGKLTSYSGKW